MRNNALTTALAAAGLLAAASAFAQTTTHETSAGPVTATVMTDGLSHPWGMAFLPDGSVLVTEREGRLRLFADGALSAPISGVPEVADTGQGGLLDVALASDFAETGTIFLSFSEPGRGGQGTAIARARLVRDGAPPRLEDVRVIFTMAAKTRSGRHFGSRIVPAPDGTIFFTIGDRGDDDRAQDMNDHAGAVLRINPDGSVPRDNPWTGQDGTRPELWSKGHRNPQGATWDPVTDSLWITEHGARGGDELNQPQRGRNYGWPVISYGAHYSGAKIGVGSEAPGYEQPEFYWDPSIAPSGLTVYDGTMFPEWQGDFLAGALKFQLVSRVERGANGEIGPEERIFEGAFGRIRDIEVASDGAIWLITDEDPGQLVRIAR
ncbi:PQQ-dependent sugar dehydrogenase [Zhengella sp. ZM62]|uniref:PQQ-dependent sugar dehydrogenase n=1 Tax=Zhengella sedimenti TaxID=3390035 RepID=UPI0039761F3A